MALLNNIGSLVQAIPYIYTQYKGKDLKGQKRSSAQLENLSDAMVNPNNATYQGLYQSNRGSQQQDLASTIAEISRQNRKLVSMGRTPLLDQERGGETVFRNLIMGNQQAGSNARAETQNQLRNALAGQGANFQAQKDLSESGYGNRLLKANAAYGLGGLARTYDPETGSFGDEAPQLEAPQTQQANMQAFLKALFGLNG